MRKRFSKYYTNLVNKENSIYLDLKYLEKISNDLRIDILNMVYNAGSGHIGGSFSIIDFLTYIYFEELNILDYVEKEKKSKKKTKEFNKFEKTLTDKVIMSKAHASPALYALLAKIGIIEKNELKKFRRIDGKLEGHITKKASKYIDYSGGSLGQGLSFGVGIAKFFKYLYTLKEEELKKTLGVSKIEKYQRFRKELLKRKILVILGDGELGEGQNYEAMLLASHLKLDNLCVVVDKNKIQLDGFTKDILNTDPIIDKFNSFGFNAIEINGHDFVEMKIAFDSFKANLGTGKPFLILLNTIKGKGVNFMENSSSWHGKTPNKEEYVKALNILGGTNEKRN